MLPAVSQSTAPGAAAYTPLTLAAYDVWVLQLTCRLVWRCPRERLLALYDRHAGARHLDVGVGTGWLLDHARFPVPHPEITLLDLNESSLAAAARRIARHAPRTHHADVLEPLDLGDRRFDSIAMTMLLHCLPGPLARKGAAFEHLKAHLTEGGTLFGATALSSGVPNPPHARGLMALYNRLGVFGNAHDDLGGLRGLLDAHFAHVELETCGSFAFFAARDPRESSTA